MFLKQLEQGHRQTHVRPVLDPEAELPSRPLHRGHLPHCSYGEARGDQCDECGRILDATDLIDPRSKITGATQNFVPPNTFTSATPTSPTRSARLADKQDGGPTFSTS